MLGTVGDCESTSSIGFTWSSAGVALTTDRIGGNYALSTTASSSTAIFQIDAPNMVVNKYYFFSLYIKNPSTTVEINSSYSQYPTQWIQSVTMGANSGWTRVGIKFHTYGISNMTLPRVGYNVPASKNVLMDNAMLMEITVDEYNGWSEQTLLSAYPYKNT
ncbi:hypothetical protein D3C87_80480 [compost metagenome]